MIRLNALMASFKNSAPTKVVTESAVNSDTIKLIIKISNPNAVKAGNTDARLASAEERLAKINKLAKTIL